MTSEITRRKMLQFSTGAAAFACAARTADSGEKQAPEAKPINTRSAPSGLKISNMRACTIAANYD